MIKLEIRELNNIIKNAYLSDKGIEIYDENNKIIAYIEVILDNEMAIINKTFVDESLRGSGIASMMLEILIKDLENRNIKFVSKCSYATNWLNKNKGK